MVCNLKKALFFKFYFLFLQILHLKEISYGKKGINTTEMANKQGHHLWNYTGAKKITLET